MTGPIPASLGGLSNLRFLSLSQNRLTGPVPAWLGRLSNLQYLILAENELTGTITPELGSLYNLQWLYLSDNQLTGTIPPRLRWLFNLERLILWGNELTGTIPTELGNLGNLQVLSLGGNELTGTIPTELGNLGNLQELYLHGNELSGTIPPHLDSLYNLQVLSLGGNELTGTVPTYLGGFYNLQELYLWGNELTGTIPTELGSLYNLRDLYLSGNKLTGTVPSQLGNLGNLQELVLWGNELTGTIPPHLGSLSNLQVLSLSGNELTGTIPPHLGSLSNLQELYLRGNQLDGCVPQGLRDVADNDFDDLGLPFCDLLLSSLTLSPGLITPPFDPYHTDYTAAVEVSRVTAAPANDHNAAFQFIDQNRGEITDADGSLDGLQVDLGAGVTTIRIRVISPDGLGSRTYTIQVSPCATRGAVTNAAHNRRLVSDCDALLAARDVLAGSATLNWSATLPIADWDGVTLGGSPLRITRLILRDSQLTGTIPPELDRLANLGILALGGNQLSGPIPPELSGLANLQELWLNDNQLIGPIPSQLASLTNLKRLSLYDNQLTGTIPPELGSLYNLRDLSLSGNKLTGPIPTGLGSLASLEELFLSGNQLTGCIPAGIAGVANNDLNQLGLPFCTGVRVAPTISAVTPGMRSLTVAWAAPGGASGPAITAYDLRYIESAAGDKADPNWTVVEDVWTTGSGALNHQVTGLTHGTQYDLQVRSANADGDGPWSASLTATPSNRGGLRSFSPASVSPGGVVVVEVAVPAGYGSSGQVVETLPPRFTYVSGSLSDSRVQITGRVITFTLAGEGRFTYTATAPGAGGSYVFSGVLRNSQGEQVPVGGAFRIVVEAAPPGVSASRSFSPASVAPGGEVVVTINAASYGVGGAVTETLPEGFTYVSSSLPDSQVSVTGQQVSFTLQGDTSFTYTVTAPSVEGSYAFSGTLGDDKGNDHDVGADATLTVSSRDPLVAQYDTNKDGMIDKPEVIAAFRAYVADPSDKTEMIAIFRQYVADTAGSQ